MAESRRWPKWVYEPGSDPDYRFSFANERTLLAWLRTALALLAAGVALHAFDTGMRESVERLISSALLLAGVLVAGSSWVRWARSERAMREGDSLPTPNLSTFIIIALVVVATVVIVIEL